MGMPRASVAASMKVTAAICLLLLALAGTGTAKVRTHYIAAEEVMWNYAPTGMNVFKGVPLLEDPESFPFFVEGPTFIGGTYIKALFFEYTDATFTEKKDMGPDWEHMGFLGPPLFAEVGDTFEIHFRNLARYDFSMYPMGLSLDPVDDDGDTGASVAPGDDFVYRWDVPARSGPAPGDWSSTMFPYISNVDIRADTNAGLIGPIVVTAKGMANEDGRPKDVDREFFQMYIATSEIESRYIVDNANEFLGGLPPEEFLASFDWFITNLMHGVNGMLFNNLPGLTMTSYERVRWYIYGMGSDFDIHTVHLHGQTFLDRGLHRADVTAVYPGTVSVVDMVPDSPGIWLTHCHVNAHVSTGMMALFEVLPASSGYSTARNLATTAELFSSLFDSDTDYSAVVTKPEYSTDPFSSAPAVFSVSVTAAVAAGLMVLLAL